MKTIELFSKDYDGESLYDLGRDVSEAIDERFNPLVTGIPCDNYGIQEGTFKVTITWHEEEDE